MICTGEECGRNCYRKIIRSVLLIIFLTLSVSCDKPKAAPSVTSSPTAASTVPAATDLILAMGGRDRLVAQSNYDHLPNVPKAGDYQTIDWELLRQLHPQLLITEVSPDRQGPGFKSNAAELGITPINVKIETLDDIFKTIDLLGDSLKLTDQARTARLQLHARLQAVRDRVGKQQPVSTLIVIDSSARYIAGPGTYLDDLLKIAGGVNAAAGLGHWPQIDPEMLMSLKPQAIIELLPGAKPPEREQAAAVWKQHPGIPAVAAGRIYPMYDDFVLVPGWHVVDLAERMAGCLHPEE